jgi:hypothetical protein
VARHNDPLPCRLSSFQLRPQPLQLPLPHAAPKLNEAPLLPDEAVRAVLVRIRVDSHDLIRPDSQRVVWALGGVQEAELIAVKH